jgi:SAM-dependent methyltransferase
MSITAKFWSAIGHQLRCPSGRAGRLAGKVMTLVNKEPNRLAIAALNIQPADTVLDLGFGPGSAVQKVASLAHRGLVLGIDASCEMLAQASSRNRSAIDQGRVSLRLGAFDKLPWCAGTIDKILAVNVAYFFHQDGHEVREAHRVLKPGGLMAVYATDIGTMSKWRFSGPETHILYGEKDLRALLLSGGFFDEEISVRPATLSYGIRSLLAVARKISPAEQYS